MLNTCKLIYWPPKVNNSLFRFRYDFILRDKIGVRK